MQKSMPLFAFLAINLFISTSYADNKPMDAETFSNMVKQNQQAAQQAASSEANKMTGNASSQSNASSTSNAGSSSASDQARNSMNSSNATTPAATTPPANTAPTTSQPTINPSTSAPASNSDPYPGYTGQSNDKANADNSKAPANKTDGDQNKGWNLGY